MYDQIKMSHSIHMLSIQIDDKSFELVIRHQVNSIKLSFFQVIWNGVFHYGRFIDAVRVIDFFLRNDV